jgi:hypothetical protein
MTHLPQYHAFLAALPEGLASYPDALEKSAVNRHFLAGATTALGNKMASFPEPLRKVLVEPPPHSSWVSQVLAHAVRAAVRDLLFPSLDDYLAYALRGNRDLLGSPVYAFLFRLVGPKTILRGAQGRWGQLHRGMSMTVESDGENRCVVTLGYPAGLVVDAEARSYAVAFQAAMELSGARGVSCSVAAFDRTGARFLGRWS